MNVTKLKALGKAALNARLSGNMKEWNNLINLIDEETKFLKSKYPNMFWKWNDPEYRIKVKAWALKRKVQ
jgi:hypothetical protein